MESITFTCETITPMFLSGADGKTAELRPPSIKGALRFWWRAVYPGKKGDSEKEKIRIMNEEESNIFGGTESEVGRSKIIILPVNESSIMEIEKIEKIEISLTPHHRDGYCSLEDKNKHCYFMNDNKKDKNDSSRNKKQTVCKKGQKQRGKMISFHLTIILNKSDKSNFSIEQVQSLFLLSMLLGGLGKRSRRGFGSIKINQINGNQFPDKIDLPTIKEWIQNISPNRYNINGNIIINTSDIQIDYPFLKEIQIGKEYKNYEELLVKIGESSHKNNIEKYSDLGFAKGKDRFSSPIYVSVLKYSENDYRPIITTLNTAIPKGISVDYNKQKDFKKMILDGGKSDE